MLLNQPAMYIPSLTKSLLRAKIHESQQEVLIEGSSTSSLKHKLDVVKFSTLARFKNLSQNTWQKQARQFGPHILCSYSQGDAGRRAVVLQEKQQDPFIDIAVAPTIPICA